MAPKRKRAAAAAATAQHAQEKVQPSSRDATGEDAAVESARSKKDTSDLPPPSKRTRSSSKADQPSTDEDMDDALEDVNGNGIDSPSTLR